MIRFLLYLVKLLSNKQPIQSINRQDIDIITKAFPVFSYKKGMTIEEIAIGTAQSVGQQQVIEFVLSRIRGRIGVGVAYE